MKTILITESQCQYLTEDVYLKKKGIDTKKKKAQLTYNSTSRGYERGERLNNNDKLTTDKMLQSNGDTYEVKLKNGIVSYNITSIEGKETMHYFKNKFSHKDTSMNIDGENYALWMEDGEFNRFLEDFKRKVGNVVKYKMKDFKPIGKDGFSGISIYPVPSSSQFNIVMAQILKSSGFYGMNVEVIDTNILKKDTSKLEADEDFINKNKEYYNGQRYSINSYSHLDALKTDLNKLRSHQHIFSFIERLNELSEEILKKYYTRNKTSITPRQIENIGKLYCDYVKQYEALKKSAEYYSEIDKKMKTRHESSLVTAIKYSKGPSIENRTGEIWAIAKKSSYKKMIGSEPINVCRWEPQNFQIKKFGNDTRMGLKNYFKANDDYEQVKKEVEKTKNTIIIVFDDNVSGGATLSDICLQLKTVGMENILPITFGQMGEYWGPSKLQINKPTGGFNME